MTGKYNLSDREYEIMEMVWERNKQLTFNDFMNFLNEEQHHDLKKQTVQTFLTRLVEKRALDFEKVGNKKFYHASMAKEEYVQMWTKGLLNTEFDGSLKNFMVALSGGKRLGKEDIEELRQLLNENE